MDTPDQGKLTYAAAGVDIDAATEAKKRIRKIARATFTPGVLTDIGSFGALFRLAPNRWRDPLLVSSCDGVGTKLKLAFMTGIHDTVGYDLVSHCVSDIMVQGARPLFFLDYIACGGLKPEVVEQLVSGLARGCTETGCALVGGRNRRNARLLCARRVRPGRFHCRGRRPGEGHRRLHDPAGGPPRGAGLGRSAHQRVLPRAQVVF